MKAYIWRKSIYDNNFTCRCGSKLCTDNGMPLEQTLYIAGDNRDVVCKKCGWNVAILEEVNDELFGDDIGKMGEWNQSYKKGFES